MLARFAAFEIKYQVFSPLFIVTGVLFFLLSFGYATVGEIAGVGGAVNKNSPFVLNQIVLTMSLFGLFIPTAFLSSVVLRDRAFGTEGLFFTTPVRETDYLLGRFAGAYVASLLLFMVVPLAVFLGSLMPWLDPARMGPLRPFDYAYAVGVLAAPNLLVVGVTLFTVANLTRSNMATYTALVLFLVLYLTAASLANEPSPRTLATTLDPFGFAAFTATTRYWSPFELNTRLPPLEGELLWNRALWLGLALVLVVLNVRVFSFRARGVWLRRQRATAGPGTGSTTVAAALPRAAPVFSAATAIRRFLALVSYEIAGILKSLSFWMLLALGLFYALGSLVSAGVLYGTPVYPVTRVMIESLQNTFVLVPYVVLIYFASELVWRDRGYGAHEIIDATPTPGWAFALSKLFAIWLALAAMAVVAILAGIGVQVARGFADIDLWLYVRRLLLVDLYPLVLVATLSIFAQVVANNRYVGWLVILGYMIADIGLETLGLDHNIYRFARTPAAPMSDMNGDGHFLRGVFWFDLYWTLFSGILLLLTFALWNRGTLTPIWRRLARMPSRVSRATWGALAVLVVAYAATGSYIFDNTSVLNVHLGPGAAEERAIEYETRYRQYEGLAQPHVTDVKIDVDIFPRERRYEVRGTYVLENKTGVPIDQVHVGYDFQAIVRRQALEGGVLDTADVPLGYYIWRLGTPMQPGEKRTFAFTVARENPGFRGGGNVSSVVWNGTFINDAETMPWIGFNRQQIVQDRSARRRHHLDPVDRLPRIEDDAAARRSRPGSDWVMFDATLSTSPGQIAVAPGYLEREWTENGRRYFHYQTDVPIAHAFSFLSARYAVREEKAGGVELQVFYDPQHAYNVDRMIESMRDSIAYYDAAFGPYPYRQARILEFPAFHGGFAAAFPGSIPYSEGLGFIADNRDPRKIDYVYYVTAHETGHQWWGGQVIAAQTQGAAMLSETFAQYSALMVMEHKYGPHLIRRFLEYELDQYLAGRGGEQIEELPLYRVEGQDYIFYHKGAVVMYALKDYLGETAMNRALTRFLRENAYRNDPYPRTTDFIRILREEAGRDRWRQELITDLFEKIVLFDLRAENLAVTRRPDGRYDVKLTVEARKVEADGTGGESEVPLDYPIDVGFFTRSPDDVTGGTDHVLFLEKRTVHSGENVFEAVLERPPQMGAIDPYHKLVDLDADDNLRRWSANASDLQ